jgi:ERCC4-type nuclease
VRPEFADGGSAIEGLDAGDYSVRLDGELLSIRIERKNLGDLFGVCGNGRDRFVRELERLTAYEYRAIVIEAPASQILSGYERSRIPGRGVMASLCCWSVQYQIPVWFGETHRRAAGITARLLEEFAIHYYRQIRASEAGSDAEQSVFPTDRGRGQAPIPGDTV